MEENCGIYRIIRYELFDLHNSKKDESHYKMVKVDVSCTSWFNIVKVEIY